MSYEEEKEFLKRDILKNSVKIEGLDYEIAELKEVAGMKRKQIERIDELEKKFDVESGHVGLHREHKQEIAELKELHEKDIIALRDGHKNLLKEINELEKKIETLDMEKKLKIDYMMKMNQLVENDKAHQACHDKAFKEIAELEKKIDVNTHQRSVIECAVWNEKEDCRIDINANNIAELKELFDELERDKSASVRSYLEDIKTLRNEIINTSRKIGFQEGIKEIAELKERLELHTHDVYYDMLLNIGRRCANLEEVLREHINDHLYVAKEGDITKWEKHLKDSLEKLSGEKELTPQTADDAKRISWVLGEGKELNNSKPDLIIRTNIEGMEEIPCKRLDLKDEKSVGVNITNNDSVLPEMDVKRNADSKAPEPKNCPQCKKLMRLDMNSLTTGMWKCDCGFDGEPYTNEPSENDLGWNEEHLKETIKRLNEINLDEPKGYKQIIFDTRVYKLVKREDLQRIFELSEYENLDYPYNEEMKKIKEDYGIE